MRKLKHAYRDMSAFPASAFFRGEGGRSATSYHSRNLSSYFSLDRDRDNPIYPLSSFRGMFLRDISAMDAPLGDKMIPTRYISPLARHILRWPVDLGVKKRFGRLGFGNPKYSR